MREFGELEMAIMNVMWRLRSGGDGDLTMRRFLERVSDDEMNSLRSAMLDAGSQRLAMR